MARLRRREIRLLDPANLMQRKAQNGDIDFGDRLELVAVRWPDERRGSGGELAAVPF